MVFIAIAGFAILSVGLFDPARNPAKAIDFPDFKAKDCQSAHENVTNLMSFYNCTQFSNTPEPWVIASNDQLNVASKDNATNATNLVTLFAQGNSLEAVGGNLTNVTVLGKANMTHTSIFDFRFSNTSNFTSITMPALRIVRIDIQRKASVVDPSSDATGSVTPRADSETLHVVETCLTANNTRAIDGGYPSSFQDCIYNSTNTHQDFLLVKIDDIRTST